MNIEPRDPADRGARRRTLVAVATRERPVGLRTLFDSLGQCEPPEKTDVEYLVVDNDPAGSAASTVESIDVGHPIRYLHEPRAGIPFARNATLEAAAGYDFVVFVDDDETVDARWLVELHRAIDTFDADVATGPVIRTPPAGVPKWISGCGFFDQPDIPDGQLRKSARTGSVIVRMAALEARGLRFDETFPFLGGTDSWLFEQLRRDGGRIVWTQHAIAYESVPASRVTARWLIRRSFRVGLASTRRRRLADPGVRSLVMELARIGWRSGDALRLVVIGPFSGSSGVMRAVMRAAEATGTLAGLFPVTIDDYRHVDGA